LKAAQTSAQLEQILADHLFLKGLDQHYLERISPQAAIVSFKKDEHILLEGQEAAYFFLILKGQAVLKTFLSAREGFMTIQYLGQGEIIGWSWLVPPYQWHFSAFATKPTTAIRLDGHHLRQAAEADPAFGYELQRRLLFVIGQRLRRTRRQVGQEK
ncbi:MAG: Crp/Fnr family transcriptional regulator, partial [Anaerolineae bacterium]|nr:Crp/Fnr family transcriptional regulator [Anaerolineae bacterium]